MTSDNQKQGVRGHLLLFAGILVLGLDLLQIETFRWIGPFASQRYFLFLLFIGLGLTAFGLFKISKPVSLDTDLPKIFAYPLLGVVFAGATSLELDHIGKAFSGYWADSAMAITDIATITDLHVFPLVIPSGARPPFYSYLCALIWWMFPFLKGLVMQRIASCVVSFVTYWVLYRLGREISGKRVVGVLLAAMAAASKPYLIQIITGYGGLTLILAVSLYLLFQFRLFRDPSLKRFLQWGLVLAFGVHTYTAIVPWVPFLAVANLIYLMWKREGRPIEIYAIGVTVLFTVCYILFYIDRMAFLFHDNPIARLWGSNGSVWFLMQVAFLAALVHAYRSSQELGRRFCSLGLGLLLVGFICYPISMNMGGASRIAEESLLPKTVGGWFSADFINSMLRQTWRVFHYVFDTGGERSDMNVLGDPFFDYQAVLVVIVGLLYAAIRPTWTKSFLLICALIGTTPYFLTGDNQGAKFCGTFTPLLLLGAMALGHWMISAWRDVPKAHWAGIVLIAAFSAFWIWEIKTTRERVYVKWWNEVWNDDMCVGQEVEKALPEKRVYLSVVTVPHNGHFFDAMTQSALHDPEPLYLLSDKNVIAVSTEQKRQDIMVIVSPLMKDIVKRLKRDFPKAQWTPAWQYYQKSHDEVPFLYSVTIAAADIPERTGKLFQFLPVSSTTWRRDVYWYRMGLREGVVRTEDHSDTLNPMPPAAAGNPVAARGGWEAPADGNYTLSMPCGEYARLFIDGQEVLTALRGHSRPVSKTLSMKKGYHDVRYQTYLVTAGGFMDVTVENRDLNYKMILGAK